MSDFSGALGVVLAINLVLFMAQISVGQINPEVTDIYNCQGNIYGDFNNADCTNYKLDTEKATDGSNFPENPTVIDSALNYFTDVFNAVKTWFLDSLGAKYVINVLKAPYNFLSLTGLPQEFVFILGSFWYMLTFFLLVQEMRGTG